MNCDSFLYSKEVKRALSSGQPILALESTIITHGLPRSAAADFLNEANEVVRSFGAVPATIAVIGGSICVGLNDHQQKHLLDTENLVKISFKDLGLALSSGSTGGTTVSSTVFVAHSFGASVFSTGGIGGVHRNAEHTFDVSQDILALSRFPVITVSAGVKAILDIQKTREALETFSVPIIGYKTKELPVFYSKTGGGKLDWSANSLDSLSAFLRSHLQLGMGGGVLVANPPPKENEIPLDKVNAFVSAALSEAEELKIEGKQLTPFLLKKISLISKGESIESNIALALNNIALGARLAVSLKA